MLFKMIKDDIAWKTAMKKCKIRKVRDADWQVCKKCKANRHCEKLAEYKKVSAEKCGRRYIATDEIHIECYTCIAKEYCEFFKQN